MAVSRPVRGQRGKRVVTPKSCRRIVIPMFIDPADHQIRLTINVQITADVVLSRVDWLKRRREPVLTNVNRIRVGI